jgi:hypothetical protein
MNLNPVFTAAAIVVAVSLLGLIISYWRQSRLFRGYEEYTSDAQNLAGRLKAEVFRDRTDLVISGNYGKLPTIVRFSYADNTPGLNVRMRAPATFTMSVVPKGGRATEGRVLLRTPDDVFDSRFATRTDHPTQARIFVAGKAAFAQIQKLCCSSQTFLTLTSGGVELSELTIPSPYAAQHIQAHLESMAALAQALQQMPGADAIKITPYKKEHSKIIRAALAVGVLTAIVAVVGAMYDRGSTAAADGAGTTSQDVPAGVPLADAQRIGALAGFRLATASDFNDGGAWVRSQTGHEVSGHTEVAFSGDTAQDKAYVFVQDSGPNAGIKRLVLLVGNEVKYDAGYQELAAIGRVPRSNLAGIPWTSTLRPPDGDGLLLVRKSDDPRSGTVIYFSGGRMETAAPTNYQNVGIQ